MRYRGRGRCRHCLSFKSPDDDKRAVQETFPLPEYEQRGRRAVVTINGRQYDLGKFGSEDSHEEYARVTGEYDSAGRPAYFGLPVEDLTVGKFAAYYQDFAYRYYGHGRTEAESVKYAMRPMLEAYSRWAVKDFGPIQLKAVVNRMISRGWCRSHCNSSMQIVVRAFRWGVSQGLVAANVLYGLQSVAGLRHGRTTARESVRVLPVTDAVVEATLTQLSSVVSGMVEFQRLTGCRPGEVCLLRPRDVDRTGPVWKYRPRKHKTQHRGRDRVIMIGPKAQAVLTPFLLRPADEHCFSPKEAQREQRRLRRAHRKTPLSCGNRRGTNRQPEPQRPPGAHYTTQGYGYAIRRACLRADVPAWGPNRLRHATATEIRKAFGLEAVQVVLGHATADVTQVYAERDMDLAERIALAVG